MQSIIASVNGKRMHHRLIALLFALAIVYAPSAWVKSENRTAAKPYLNMPSRADGKIPPLLSQTGAFSDTRHLIPAGTLVPYDLVVAFWSDGASKSRWIAVPDQKIKFSATGVWVFPAGTVFVKNFELST